MSDNRMTVELRENTGKGAARKLRATARIPAVIYGKGSGATSLSLDPHELLNLLSKSDRGLNTLIDVEAKGDASFGKRTVLVKELQRDPVQGQLLHADLYEVDLSKTVEVEVPIHIAGTPPGVSLSGGILDHALRELLIECLPGAIPEAIEADVSQLEIGDSLHVRDLPLPAGVELRSDSDLAVVSVSAPTVEEVPVAAAGEEVPEGAEGEEAPEGAEGAEAAAEGEKPEGGAAGAGD